MDQSFIDKVLASWPKNSLQNIQVSELSYQTSFKVIIDFF